MTPCWNRRWPMSADTLERLFREFCLPTMAARFADMMQSAEVQNWGYRKLLVQLCEAEAADRRERKRERLLRESRLPFGKTDFSEGQLIRRSGLFEAEVEFEVVKPRHAGIDSFLLQPLGKVFKVLFPLMSLGSVVISDQDRVLVDAHVAFQAAEQVAGEMDRIPLVEGRTQALAQLVDEPLGQQGQGHLSQPDVEVQGAGAFPAQVLIKAKELLDVPTIRKSGRRSEER